MATVYYQIKNSLYTPEVAVNYMIDGMTEEFRVQLDNFYESVYKLAKKNKKL